MINFVGNTSALPTQRNIKLKGGGEHCKSERTAFNKIILNKVNVF